LVAPALGFCHNRRLRDELGQPGVGARRLLPG
jgi:hypothetical protein